MLTQQTHAKEFAKLTRTFALLVSEQVMNEPIGTENQMNGEIMF